jgi:hypothetical protein
VTGRKEENTVLFAERRRTLIAALVAVMVLTLPGIALAQDDKDTTTTVDDVTATTTEEEPTAEVADIPEPSEVLSMLPVLGAGLNITVGRDDEGVISSIALDPDTATVVKESDHRVVFLLSDGNTEVVVKSGKGFVQTTVRANATEDASGDGAWSADVFGNGLVTVPYSVSFDGITPTIEVGSVTTPDDVTAEVGEVKTKISDDADKAYSKVRIALTSGDQTATLSLKAKVYVNDEGETKVKVSATLSSRDRVNCRDEGRHGDRRHDNADHEWRAKRDSEHRGWGDGRHGDRDSRRGHDRTGVGG